MLTFKLVLHLLGYQG